jgi:catechol 2,3-dioxygenase-like lactoylglutathione lyase family enzyme/ketosteroid isomerase-like protein
MLDHISIGVSDIVRTRTFYDAALAPLGYMRLSEGEGSLGYGRSGVFFWISRTERPVPADTASGLHVCFAAPDRAAVAAFHAAALAHGGADNGKAGLREDYGADYFAAFAIDPDGYRIEAYCGDKQDETATLAELRALNARFIHNFVTNDVASHDALLHPDFVYMRANGALVDRASYLRDWATGFDADVIPYWDTRDETITLIGPVALVRAVNKHVIRASDGRETTGMSAYTDVYLREGGRWLCVQAQITPVAAEAEPADDAIVNLYIAGKLQEPGR